MRTWGIVCGLLSGVLLGGLILSMNTCGDAYVVGSEGELFKMDESVSGRPVRGPKCAWDAELSGFPALERWTQPGDRIHKSRTTAGVWVFEVQMTKVEVFRGEESVLVDRVGHHRFWGTIIGLSLFPMLCWGIGAWWIVLLSPRRGRETGS